MNKKKLFKAGEIVFYWRSPSELKIKISFKSFFRWCAARKNSQSVALKRIVLSKHKKEIKKKEIKKKK